MLKHIFIKVPDMHCAACSARVEKVLNNLPGVVEANVNLAAYRASVKYQASEISMEEITQAISKAGYTPVAMEQESEIKQTFVVEGMT